MFFLEQTRSLEIRTENCLPSHLSPQTFRKRRKRPLKRSRDTSPIPLPHTPRNEESEEAFAKLIKVAYINETLEAQPPCAALAPSPTSTFTVSPPLSRNILETSISITHTMSETRELSPLPRPGELTPPLHASQRWHEQPPVRRDEMRPAADPHLIQSALASFSTSPSATAAPSASSSSSTTMVRTSSSRYSPLLPAATYP